MGMHALSHAFPTENNRREKKLALGTPPSFSCTCYCNVLVVSILTSYIKS